jgi:hypothetical protein
MVAGGLSEREFLPSGLVRERFSSNSHECLDRQGTREEIQAMESNLVDGADFGRGSQSFEGSPMHLRERRSSSSLP